MDRRTFTQSLGAGADARKVWPNERPGLGVSVDEKQLTFVEAMTGGAPGAATAASTAHSRTGRLVD